jgi:cytoskeletal protein CcmA (bactofilin family)
LPATAGATEFRKGDTLEISKDETIKGDIYLTGARARVDGTVDGDLFFFGQGVDINGHIKGDAIVFAQSVRVTGQVDGNVRSFANNITITGTVARNVLTFDEVVNLDSAGKVGGSMTVFAQSLGLDGKVGRDILAMDDHTSISGVVDGDVRAKGRSMSIASSAIIGGAVRFEGDNPASVASGAKLASPVEFTKAEHKSKYTQGHYYIWRVIWTAAFVLFGLVLFLLMPKFAEETVNAGKLIGAPVGLGVLVFFGVPIAAVIACITVVGIPLAVLTFGLWILALFTAEIVVGAVVGSWILGKPNDTWSLIGRMAVGLCIVRAIYTPMENIEVVGLLGALAIFFWGMGATALTIYRRLANKTSPTPAGIPVPSAL